MVNHATHATAFRRDRIPPTPAEMRKMLETYIFSVTRNHGFDPDGRPSVTLSSSQPHRILPLRRQATPYAHQCKVSRLYFENARVCVSLSCHSAPRLVTPKLHSSWSGDSLGRRCHIPAVTFRVLGIIRNLFAYREWSETYDISRCQMLMMF